MAATSPAAPWKPRLIEPDELQAAIDVTAVAFGAGPRAPDDYRKQSTLIDAPPCRAGRGAHARSHRRADAMFRPDRAPYCSTDF